MKKLFSFHQRSGIAPNERPRSLPAVLPFLGTDRRQARSRRGRGERRESGVRPSRPSWARTSPSSCRGLAGLPDSRQLPGSLGDSWRSATPARPAQPAEKLQAAGSGIGGGCEALGAGAGGSAWFARALGPSRARRTEDTCLPAVPEALSSARFGRAPPVRVSGRDPDGGPGPETSRRQLFRVIWSPPCIAGKVVQSGPSCLRLETRLRPQPDVQGACARILPSVGAPARSSENFLAQPYLRSWFRCCCGCDARLTHLKVSSMKPARRLVVVPDGECEGSCEAE